MKLNALLNGSQVQIVNIARVGSVVYVDYINGTGNGALVSTMFQTSAFNANDIVISTSAFWLG